MIKGLVNCIKRIVVAFLMLYGFNLMVSSINLYIPLNFITVGVVSVLGIPGLLSFIVMFYVVK